MRLKMILVVALASAGLAACGGGKKGDTMEGGGGGSDMAAGSASAKSLYDRLGGKDAITAVVDKFLTNVIADDRINGFFKNADAANLKKQLVDQICHASGGPCTYEGKDMKTAHAGMGIKEADFNALVEDLVKALDEFKVPEDAKSDLLAALGGMKGDIVEQ